MDHVGLAVIGALMIVGGWLLLTRSRVIRNRLTSRPLATPVPQDSFAGLIRFIGLFSFLLGAVIFAGVLLGYTHKS